MRCVLNPENMLSPEGVFGGNPLFYWIYGLAAHIVPCWLAYVIAGVVIMLILINAVLLGAAIVSWGERRCWADSRTGWARIAGGRSARCSR